MILSFNAYKYNSFFVKRVVVQTTFFVKFYLLKSPQGTLPRRPRPDSLRKPGSPVLNTVGPVPEGPDELHEQRQGGLPRFYASLDGLHAILPVVIDIELVAVSV